MAGIVFQTLPSGGLKVKCFDQYADGKLAKVYKEFIGDINRRTKNYKEFLLNLFAQKGCKRILDVACGTGIDSIMLLEEGFEVVSTDGSDKMLKSALETRWNRRKELAFDKWIIREANWLELYDTVEDIVGEGFDAVICFASSFAHMVDSYGDQREHKLALKNFEKCLKPGGLLLIDHRNYNQVIAGEPAKHCVFYESPNISQVVTSVLSVSGKPSLVVRDYFLENQKTDDSTNGLLNQNESSLIELRLIFYPHMMQDFRNMLKETFGSKSIFTTLGDFKTLDEVENPTHYIHVVEKQM